MAPCERAGAGRDMCGGSFRLIAVRAIESRRDRLVITFAGVFAVVIVTVRHEAVLFTPESDRGPLGVGGEVPACALCLAAGAGGVKVNVCRRILARQTVRCRDTAVGQLGGVYDVLVLGIPKAGDLLPVDDKSRVGAVVAAGQHVAVLKFRDIHHNGRQIRVVHKDFIVRAHAFECQTGKIKVCHCCVLLFDYSMLQSTSVTSPMSSGFCSLRILSWFMPSSPPSARGSVPSSVWIGVSV